MSKPRRVTIDLTPAMTAELDLVKDRTGQTTAQIFRESLRLLEKYVDAEAHGSAWRLLTRLHWECVTVSRGLW